MPWAAEENSTDYIVSGKNAKGKRMGVRIPPTRLSIPGKMRTRRKPTRRLPPSQGMGRRPIDNFTVLTARFGIDDRWVDLAKQIQAKVADGRLDTGSRSTSPTPPTEPIKYSPSCYTADGQVGTACPPGRRAVRPAASQKRQAEPRPRSRRKASRFSPHNTGSTRTGATSPRPSAVESRAIGWRSPTPRPIRSPRQGSEHDAHSRLLHQRRGGAESRPSRPAPRVARGSADDRGPTEVWKAEVSLRTHRPSGGLLERRQADLSRGRGRGCPLPRRG